MLQHVMLITFSSIVLFGIYTDPFNFLLVTKYLVNAFANVAVINMGRCSPFNDGLSYDL